MTLQCKASKLPSPGILQPGFRRPARDHTALAGIFLRYEMPEKSAKSTLDNILAVGTAAPSQAHLPAMRRCLCCNRQFKSAHAGNRICGPCLQRDRESGLPASIQQASV